MAYYKQIIPFIIQQEGGWVDNPNDPGGETNKGITFATWKQCFGDTHARFMSMNQADWQFIFKKYYWDAVLADQIKSQKVANIIVDWVWCSGKYWPEEMTQALLNTNFGAHLTKDGIFGTATIAAINAMDEARLIQLLTDTHINYIHSIVTATPKLSVFLQGWLNRVNALTQYNKSHG